MLCLEFYLPTASVRVFNSSNEPSISKKSSATVTRIALLQTNILTSESEGWYALEATDK